MAGSLYRRVGKIRQVIIGLRRANGHRDGLRSYYRSDKGGSGPEKSGELP